MTHLLAAFVPDPVHPWTSTPAEAAHHRAFLDHEHQVAASYPAALAREPGLRCAEHEARTPFVPPIAA